MRWTRGQNQHACVVEWNIYVIEKLYDFSHYGIQEFVFAAADFVVSRGYCSWWKRLGVNADGLLWGSSLMPSWICIRGWNLRWSYSFSGQKWLLKQLSEVFLFVRKYILWLWYILTVFRKWVRRDGWNQGLFLWALPFVLKNWGVPTGYDKVIKVFFIFKKIFPWTFLTRCY